MSRSDKKAKTNKHTQHWSWKGLKKWAIRHPYWSSYIIGCIYYGLTVSWMFGLRTAEIATGIAFVVVAFSAALVMTSSFALGLVFLTWLIRRLKLSILGDRWWLIPFVWIVTEYLRAVFFSIIAFGPGGRIGAYWTFGNIGYAMVHTPLVFAARWGGLYMLSLIAAGLIVGLIRTVITRNVLPVAIPLAIATILSLTGWLMYGRPSGPTRSIGVMQFGNEFSPENFSASTADRLSQQPSRRYDTVILPEYSHLWENNATRDTEAISRVLKDPKGLVIDSTQEKVAQGLGHNLVTYHSGDGTHLNAQQKWFSIPGGEYVPYLYQVILAYVGQEQMLLHFNDQKSINHGETPEQPYSYQGVSWGSLACSGVIAPELYRGMVERGATVLTNSASLDTMGFSMTYHYQARDMAVLHAVANARPFAQAARGGLSYIIDQNGNYIQETNQRGYGFLEGDIQTNSTKTIYTLLGDWVVWVAGLLVLGGWLTMLESVKKYITKWRQK